MRKLGTSKEYLFTRRITKPHHFTLAPQNEWRNGRSVERQQTRAMIRSSRGDEDDTEEEEQQKKLRW